MGIKIQIGEPSAPFKPFIRYYKYVESDLTGIYKAIPASYVELYFSFCHINLFSPGTYRLDYSLISMVGLHAYDQNIYARMNLADRTGGFVIVFQPEGFYNLFNVKSSDFYKYAIDGELVFKRDFYNLWNELQTCYEIAEMMKLVEDFLSYYVKRASCRFNIINNIINYMDKINGMTRVSHLCKLFNITPRSLDRQFKDEIGISPKELMNIFRINNAIKLIADNPDSDLTEISYLSGFYDQSHFIKEIKKIIGVPPGNIRGSETSKVSTVHNILFVKTD